MKHKISSDLTVIGAGIAGIVAAISAARLGLHVALINDRDVPGGNASSENRIHINGGASCNNSVYSRESGIADEIKLAILHYNPRYNSKKDFHLSDMAILNMILNEPNISYFPSTVATDCKTENGMIKEVYAFCSKQSADYVFTSPLFCDASGDGTIAYKSGAEYRLGREAKDEYNESLAPDKADDAVMGSCILYSATHEGAPVSFKKPDFAYDFVKDGIIKYFDRPQTGRELPKVGDTYGGTWWLEYGGLQDTMDDCKEIDFELKKLVYGYWDYIKNSGKYPDAEDCSISWIAPYASKRESRRFMSDYVLTQNDIANEKHFDDAVATGGWSLDIHDVGGIYGNGNTSEFGEVKSMYNIPYSIMYSKNINNLFLAGRIISCTHVAFGSLRVMETLGAMAQAVGTAAYLCKENNVLPRDVAVSHVKEMQNILQKNGQYIMNLREDCGKAENAKITASSVKLLENKRVDKLISIKNGVVYTVPIYDKFSGISAYLKNNEKQTAVVNYEIINEQSTTNYHFGEVIFKGTIEVNAEFEGFLPICYDYSGNASKIFVRISSDFDVFAGASNSRITGAPSFYSNKNRLSNDSTYLTLSFANVETAPNLYSAENIINGYSRPVNAPNCWVSNGKQNEWIELEFDEPTDFNEIQLYFNPQFDCEHFNEPIRALVTDYKITVTTANGDVCENVSDNYLGVAKHNIDVKNALKVRIDFKKNGGADDFELFAVKIF